MFRRLLHSKHAIASYLLIAIMARAFVASGWMLQLPTSDGDGSAKLVICPQQTPALADWLAEEQAGHHHHHDDPHPADGSDPITVSQTGCALWAGSAIAAIAALPSATTHTPEVLQPQSPESAALPAIRAFTRLARAPPASS